VAKSYMAVCLNFFWSTVIFGTDISHGSVATQLRCGGIYKCEFVANLSLSLPVNV